MPGRKRILWVEDDVFLNKLVASKLAGLDFDLALAEDGDRAFAELDRARPDVIVLDLMLPKMDGFEILARLKEHPAHKTIPVVVLSNLGQQSDIDRAKKLGAASYLVKANFDLDEVVKEIRRVLDTAEATRG